MRRSSPPEASEPIATTAALSARVDAASTTEPLTGRRAAEADAPSTTRTATEGDELPLLTEVAQAGILFAFEGFSVGMAGWLLRAGPLVPPYIVHNQLPRSFRTILLLDLAGGAVVAWVLAGLVLWKRNARALLPIAWRLSPLIPAGLLPLLLRWELWRDRDVTFLVLASLVGLGFRATVGRALEQPLLFPTRVRDRLLQAWGRALPLGLRRRAPLVCVAIAATWYAAYFSYRTIENHWNLRTSAYDLGLEDNLVWNALHLGKPFKSSPFGGPSAIHFGNHATFFTYVIAPIYALYQHAETLLVLQALLIGFAAIPLYLFAERHLGSWPAVLIGVIYLLNPSVQGTNLYDYHYLPLGPFFLWLSLYALEARRNVLTVVAILLTLSVREDVGAGLGIIGAYLLLKGERPKAGLVVAAIGAAHFVLLKLVIMPMSLHGESSFIGMYTGLVPSDESGFGGVLKTAVGNPAFTLFNVLEQPKLVYFLQLVVPLAFLPLLRPIGILCCLPGFFFTLLSTGYTPLYSLGFQYPAHWNSYLFIGLVANLEWITRPQHDKDAGGIARRDGWLAALAVSTLVLSYQYGVLFQTNVARSAFDVTQFGTTLSDRDRRKNLAELIAMIPPRAKVVASERLNPHVSNRPDAYSLRIGIFDADYLLYDKNGLSGEENVHRGQAMDTGDFGIIATRGSFALAQRGSHGAN